MPNLYVGGYGDESLRRVSLENDRLTLLTRFPVKNASYLCLAPDGKTLYAVGETQRFLGAVSGSVHAFSVQPDGTLKQLSVKATGGADPCHVSIAAGLLWVSNYTSGSLARFRLNPDGSIGEALKLISLPGYGPVRERQEHSHVHQAQPTPDGRIAFIDLGLDGVYFLNAHAADAEAPSLTRVAAPAGSGCRHAVFPPAGDVWYAVCELESQLLAYRNDRVVARLPIGDGRVVNYPAALRLSPDGTMLAASGRGQNIVTLYKITEGGLPVQLTQVSSGGDWPRDVQFTPDGGRLLCANERSGDVTLFAVEEGRLRLIDRLTTPAPTCFVFETSDDKEE